MKPLGASWLDSLHKYLTKNKSLAINGFRAAGIIDTLDLPK